jgi:hypothetical protein
MQPRQRSLAARAIGALLFVLGIGMYFAAVRFNLWGSWHPFDFARSGVMGEQGFDTDRLLFHLWYLTASVFPTAIGSLISVRDPVPYPLKKLCVCGLVFLVIIDITMLGSSSPIFWKSVSAHLLFLALVGVAVREAR